TLAGPALRMNRDVTMAVAGADLGAAVDGSRVPMHQAVRCASGSELRFGERRHGARAYIAFLGGVDVPPVLGSRATHIRSGLGGLHGRPLRTGDTLTLGALTTRPGAASSAAVRSIGREGGVRLRVLPGPQEGRFPDDSVRMLLRTRFVVSPASDRMGY